MINSNLFFLQFTTWAEFSWGMREYTGYFRNSWDMIRCKGTLSWNTGYKTWILNHWSTLIPEFLIGTPAFLCLPPLVFHYRHDLLLSSFQNEISCLTAHLRSPGIVAVICSYLYWNVLLCFSFFIYRIVIGLRKRCTNFFFCNNSHCHHSYDPNKKKRGERK